MRSAGCWVLGAGWFICNIAFADTIVMSQGQEIKGLVLEEYADRILLSTYEGEKILFKNEIQTIRYDEEDKQWIQKGNNFREIGDYQEALACYKKAFEINPESSEIKRLISSTWAQLEEQDQQKTMNTLEMRNELFQMSHRELTQDAMGEKLTPLDRLRSELGLILKDDDGKIKIGIRYGSAASQSGFQSGDVLLAMEGEMTSYRSVEETAQLFLDTNRAVLETMIERSVSMDPSNPQIALGCQFSMEYEGLTIQSLQAGSPAEKMGLAQGDRVTEINGAATRYLPYREAMAVIEQALKTSSLTLTIQRQLWLMREAT